MLQFENVSFRYAEDDFDMMRNLNFQVEDREFVSIIGASGCGKSTISALSTVWKSYSRVGYWWMVARCRN